MKITLLLIVVFRNARTFEEFDLQQSMCHGSWILRLEVCNQKWACLMKYFHFPKNPENSKGSFEPITKISAKDATCHHPWLFPVCYMLDLFFSFHNKLKLYTWHFGFWALHNSYTSSWNPTSVKKKRKSLNDFPDSNHILRHQSIRFIFGAKIGKCKFLIGKTPCFLLYYVEISETKSDCLLGGGYMVQIVLYTYTDPWYTTAQMHKTLIENKIATLWICVSIYSRLNL